MSDDRIVVREPRVDLGTNREVPRTFTGEEAYRWLGIHHPQTNADAVRAGNPAAVDRPAAFVEGELEAVRTRGDRNGIPLVMKDLILETTTGRKDVMVPSPVSGYAEFRNDGTNAISLWSKPIGSPDNELVGQVLHGQRGSSPFQPGDFVPYGAPLVRQSDVGSPGAVHAHIEVEPEQFKRYLGDILSERINLTRHPDTPRPAPIDPLSDGVLVREERGEAVKRLQEALNRAGIRDAEGNPLPTTGYFGERTEAAVRRYQEQQGLEVDGKAGRDTLGALGLRAADPARDGQTRPAPTEPRPTGQTPPAEQRPQPQTQPQQQQPQPQPQPQPQANPYGFGAENPLGNVIARGEGGYNSYNRGVAGDARGAQIDFSQMTVAEVMRRQSLPGSDPDRLFAVGKYQFTPDTLSEAIRSTGVDPNARFTPQLQEKLFADYLIDEKRPSVRAYITGQTSGPTALGNAQHALALEFASVGDPRKGGRGYYDGDSAGNMASTSPQQIATALEQMRTQYAANIAAGMAPEAAYRALSGDPTRFPQTTQGDPARAQDPMADGVLKRGERGESVRRLQEALNQAGIRDANGQPLPTTGYFGDMTEGAVRRFQERQGLEVDGKAGRQTLGALGLPTQMQQEAATPTQQTPTQQPSAQQAPTQQTPTQQTPAQQTPAQQTPASDPKADFQASEFLKQQSPQVRAYLDLVAWKEVHQSLNADGSPAGYRERNGVAGSRGLMPESAIADNGTLPRDELRYNVGRYQMKQVDVDDMRARYDRRIDDFSPESQDRIAVAKMQYRGVMEPLMNGDIRTAIQRGGQEWASLPGSPYGQVQPGYTADQAVAYYNQRLAFHQALDRGQTPPTQSNPVTVDPMSDGVLKHGERGESVKRLQEALNQAGIRDANGQPLPTTGYFGDMTEDAVRRFQERQGLEVDGKAGRQTLSALGLPTQMQQEAATPTQQTPTQQTPAQQTPSTETRTESTQPRSDQVPSQTTLESTRPNAQPPGQPDKLPQPDLSDKPLISNPNHPDHRLYEQAMSNLRQLGPNAGFKSQDEMERAAAAVAADAKASGLSEITHISKSQAPNGQSYLIAVQGNPTNPASKNAYLEYGQAVNQTVDQSSRMADANRVAQEQQQQQQRQQVATQERPDDQGRMSMGAR